MNFKEYFNEAKIYPQYPYAIIIPLNGNYTREIWINYSDEYNVGRPNKYKRVYLRTQDGNWIKSFTPITDVYAHIIKYLKPGNYDTFNTKREFEEWATLEML